MTAKKHETQIVLEQQPTFNDWAIFVGDLLNGQLAGQFGNLLEANLALGDLLDYIKRCFEQSVEPDLFEIRDYLVAKCYNVSVVINDVGKPTRETLLDHGSKRRAKVKAKRTDKDDIDELVAMASGTNHLPERLLVRIRIEEGIGIGDLIKLTRWYLNRYTRFGDAPLRDDLNSLMQDGDTTIGHLIEACCAYANYEIVPAR